MKIELTDLIGWSHFFLAEVLEDGDAALDLTAGGGQDTLFLARQVGPGGKVFSFDIQEQAIERTIALLEKENITFCPYAEKTPRCSDVSGVYLFQSSHVRIDHFVKTGLKGVIANLGYLPGGDKKLTTLKESTLISLHKAAKLIQPGGRLVVVVYVGHPGGMEEEREVSCFFQSLAEKEWRSLKIMPGNRKNSPVLWAAEKYPSPSVVQNYE
jgi:16S rRNA C1402 N4-methylase RsmH